MDGDSSTSEQDQISLYGLFGDSSTTLQGLNDHLTPLLLQQSPPCGSANSAQIAISKFITASPPRGTMNSLQHGVLLSDLADRSPSAGSVTACCHVSCDNLRCMNLVSTKGRRFCSQHKGEATLNASLVKKAVFEQEVHHSPIGFIPVTPSMSNSTVLNATQLSINKTEQTVKLDVKPDFRETNGLDVPDNVLRSGSAVIIGQKMQSPPQVRFVRKVGQQITVSTKSPMGTKSADTGIVKQSISVNAALQNVQAIPTYAPQASKSVHLSSAPADMPYYKKVEPTGSKMISQPVRLASKSLNAKTLSLATDNSPIQSYTTNAKPQATNEDVIKKLVEVLNSRNDLTPQQQISLLQSMGVTVVHAPSGRKRKPANIVGGKIAVSKSKNVVLAQPSAQVLPVAKPVTVPTGHLQHSFTSNNGAVLKLTPMPSAVLGQEATVTTSLPFPVERIKKVEKKPSQKRKKPAANLTAKKTKPDEFNEAHEYSAKQRTNETNKRKTMKLSDKLGRIEGAASDRLIPSFLTAHSSPKLLKVSPQMHASFAKLTRCLNEHILSNHEKLDLESIELDNSVASEIVKTKTLKSRLLKEHISRKRKAQSRGDKFNYEQCLRDLRGADVCELFSGAKNIFGLVQCGKAEKRSMVHHEKILDDLMSDVNFLRDHDLLGKVGDFDVLRELAAVGTEENSDEKGKIAFTLQTMHLRKEHERLVKEWGREKAELNEFLECYEEDPTKTMKLMNSAISGNSTKRWSMLKGETSCAQRCQLSSDNGLSCNAQPLPYAHYCKQHIWHCESQCLYKLDQSMKPVADILPEPMVKRARKRTKLLPLIKKYKKKKRKKPETVNVQNFTLKANTTSDKVPQGENLRTSIPQRAPAAVNTVFSSFDEGNHGAKFIDSDLDDTKSSDTSEDNLSLTTAHRIMLSGVLDKLPDDPQEFDLFTTDKGAEELERALLLAASSPFPDQENDDMDLGLEPITQSSSRDHALGDLDTTAMLSNPKLNHSPDAIVNCDAPKSMEQPPSLESFNQSQIVHYTFGSNVPLTAMKKDLSADGYSTGDDITPSMISAEDLRDLEGVLEKLHAEEVNSPKLPSSPAVDHYTSMLARQLSQEVEGETLKEQESSTPVLPGTCSPFQPMNGSSLSHSFSLPSTSLQNAPKSLVVNRNVALVKDAGKELMNQNQNSGGHRNRVSSLPAADMENLATGTRVTASYPQNVCTSQSLLLNMHSSVSHDPAQRQVARSLSGPSVLSLPDVSSKFAVRKSNAVSSVKLPNQISAYSASAAPQAKVQQTSVMSGPVLPLTLMQSSSQGGNVIKVIVPPGTMVNGANGQQNMLLIPVGALMKSNSASGNIPSGLVNATAINQNSPSTVNVKTQLSSLQAGQQFFVVNNAPTGSSQPHLALVQKPMGIGSNSQQKGVFLKPSQRSVALQKNETSTVGRQELGQDQANQASASNIKSNLNLQLKHMKNQLRQSKLPSPLPAVDGKVNGILSSISGGSVISTTATPSVTLSTKLATPAALSRFTVPKQSVRKGRGRGTPRKPKAKFDPITKKYVALTGPSSEVPVTPISTTPSSISPGTNQRMVESLMKFNQSTLSIQNKVQQIDSVLSSLNAAKSQSSAAGKSPINGHQEKKSKTVPWTVRSVVYPTDNNTILIPGPLKTTTVKAVPSVIATVPKVTSQLPLNIAPLTIAPGQHKIQKSVTGNTMKTATVQLKSNARVVTVTESSIAKTSELKSPTTPVSSGTVHWNQTTTAGPEITTTTLTVPVYITGAIPTGAWPGDIALNGSLPVLLPTRKISPNCQLPQRVLLGNIGSLAVPTRVRMATGAAQSSLLKQSLITVPQNPTILGSNKDATSNISDPSKSMAKTSIPATNTGTQTSSSHRIATQHLIGSTGVPTVVLNSVRLAPQHGTTSMTVTGATTVSRAHLVAGQEHVKAAADSSPIPKKIGRKASHDTILHDPLMYDPTMLDRAPSDEPT